jgi:hypothetical protein
MPAGRPDIPAQMEREVLIEAGYRCAMPRCGQTEITIDHIDDYAKVQEHRFDNLIVLCANCHLRKTQGKIDRKALQQIKAHLSTVAGRYSDLEQRVLRRFIDNGARMMVQLPGGWDIPLLHLVRDGLLVNMGTPGGGVYLDGFNLAPENYVLTMKGREFIQRWLALDPSP